MALVSKLLAAAKTPSGFEVSRTWATCPGAGSSAENFPLAQLGLFPGLVAGTPISQASWVLPFRAEGTQVPTVQKEAAAPSPGTAPRNLLGGLVLRGEGSPAQDSLTLPGPAVPTTVALATHWEGNQCLLNPYHSYEAPRTDQETDAQRRERT